MKKITTILFLSITIILGQPPRSQNSNLKFVFEPDSISLNVGESKALTVRLVDKDGKQAKGMFMVRGARRAIPCQIIFKPLCLFMKSALCPFRVPDIPLPSTRESGITVSL